MKDSIFDEREDLMVSPLGGIPQMRKVHFLKPTVSSMEGPSLKLPSLPFSSESEWPLKVSLNGCRHDHQNRWKRWVEAMESVHHSVWKAAGIYEAIMGSLYKIHMDKNLIFGLVERWCCETNTFVFPWGEATVSLEDMMILGGFSVLGDPLLFPRQSPELVEIEENLEKALRDLTGSKDNNHTRWFKYFMNNGRNFEHEAFLSLWLSRFVFPGKIGPRVFPIAVNLARGTRLALAPVVLASIYRDLSWLKQTMINSNRHRFKLKLWAPLFFLQVWAWERLVSLQPDQAQNRYMVSGVRIGRWHDVKQWGVMNVRTTIDSSGETFQWRPYALAVEGWLVPKFYKEREEWTVVEGRNLDQEMESFVRCLRASELVGIDFQEPYRPNRVAMQFGYDQDFPQWIPHSPSSPELAWYNYSRPIDSDLRLYFPSRLFEADVTTRYLEWWRKEVLFLADAWKGLSQGRRSKRRSKRLRNSPVFDPKLKQVKVETDWDVPPGFRPAAPPGFRPAAPPGFPTAAPPGFRPAVPPGFPTAPPPGFRPAAPPGFRPAVPPGFHPVLPPRSKQKHIAEVTVYKPIDYAHDGNGSSSVVPPKCNKENYKEKSMEVGQTVACDVLPPGSTEKYTDCEHDGNESNRNTARDLMTICDDLITVIELQLSELERQVASHGRC